MKAITMGAGKQAMKSVAIFNDDISLKLAIG
jgi:hypothetical protein